MSTIDEIRKKVDDLTDKAFNTGYEAGYANGMKVTANNYLPEFLEWLNNEVAIIGKDQDGKTHILVLRRVQGDPQKIVWIDAVHEFNIDCGYFKDQQSENEFAEETKTRAIANETPKEGIISSDGSEVSE